MPRLVVETAVAKQFELLEEDSIHEVTISNIEVSTFNDPVNGPRQNLNWTFTLHTPGEWEGKRVWGNTSMVFNTNPNCKLRNWAQSILGEELDGGFELDTDDLVGRKARVAIGHRAKQDGTKKQYVADVMPPKQSSAAASAWGDEPPF